MNIITGATGNIGNALVKTLIKNGESVIAITRNPGKAVQMFGNTVEVVEVDVMDTVALHEVFKKGSSIFILNPPADPAGNTDVEERKTAKSIITALKQLEEHKRVVVESTLGNQQGDHIGDLGVLYELEEEIKKLPHDYRIIRPAYYMSNWRMSLAEAKKSKTITSFYPADFKFPMVAPDDIAILAAKLMTAEKADQINPIEGPEEYSPNDVANAIAEIISKPVELKVIPEEAWEQTYQDMGFSASAAKSYSNMTKISLYGGFERPKNPVLGKTSLFEYLQTVNNLNT